MYVTCPQCDQEFFRDEPWKRVCLNCFKANKRKEREQSQDSSQREQPQVIIKVEPIPPDVLKRLMYLCHPDKHNNSRVATDMFQWLSEMKK